MRPGSQEFHIVSYTQFGRLSFERPPECASAYNLDPEQAPALSEDVTSADQITETFFLDQSGYREDHRKAVPLFTGRAIFVLTQVRAVVDAMHFAPRLRLEQTRKVAPIVFADRHHGFGAFHLGAHERRSGIKVNIFGMRSESVRNARQMVRQHGHTCRSAGRVRVQVGDSFAKQQVREVTSLQEIPEKAPPWP